MRNASELLLSLKIVWNRVSWHDFARDRVDQAFHVESDLFERNLFGSQDSAGNRADRMISYEIAWVRKQSNGIACNRMNFHSGKTYRLKSNFLAMDRFEPHVSARNMADRLFLDEIAWIRRKSHGIVETNMESNKIV